MANQVAEQLRDLIVSGSLTPGEPLLQVELAAKLGISRTPLREAFLLLERDGLVRSNPQTNTVEVAAFTEQDVVEIYQVRQVLDALAARLAAGSTISRESRVELENDVMEMGQVLEPFNTQKFMAAHMRFHVGIYELSGNRRIKEFEPILRISTQMLYRRVHSKVDRMIQSAAEHGLILDAIVAGDPARAETEASSHIAHTLKAWDDKG